MLAAMKSEYLAALRWNPHARRLPLRGRFPPRRKPRAARRVWQRNRGQVVPVGIHSTAPEDFNVAIARLVAGGAGHSAELMRAARDGAFALMIVTPTAPAPMKTLKALADSPVLIVIGDDVPGQAALGPSGWLPTRRLLEWADFAVIHGAGATVDHYRTIARLAAHRRRTILVETSSIASVEWIERLRSVRPRPIPFTLIMPIGGCHPVAEAAPC